MLRRLGVQRFDQIHGRLSDGPCRIAEISAKIGRYLIVSASSGAQRAAHAAGDAHGASDGELWRARKLTEAMVHPQSGEVIPCGRALRQHKAVRCDTAFRNAVADQQDQEQRQRARRTRTRTRGVTR